MGLQAKAMPSPGCRFEDRRKTIAWPCPRRSVFSVLLVHLPNDIALQLTGDLTGRDRRALEECAAHAVGEGPRRLILELSGLESVDDDGTAALRDVASIARRAGVDFILDSPPPSLRRTMKDVAEFR
jgi:anti-anti-sigma regulatory factor